MKFTTQHSDGVTAVSKWLKEMTLSTYGIDKEIHVIPNFVDTTVYKPGNGEVFRKAIAPNGERILTHISNFRAVKRVPDTIRIFKQVREQIPSILLLIGDGPDRSECETLARELNIDHDVRFLGKQDAILEILAASDLFLLPSQSESFGLSALEAMSCGVPVISSSIGGLPEVIIHSKTGYISELGDVDRMARYAIELLTNEKKYESFSSASRERAVTEFDSKKIVPMYEQLYEKVLIGN
jgi:N-acetyl-alpha-D-glucosaminyl L-malate synthase BshA